MRSAPACGCAGGMWTVGRRGRMWGVGRVTGTYALYARVVQQLKNLVDRGPEHPATKA
jgi:hypothetical protein